MSQHIFKGKEIRPGDTILSKDYGQYLRVKSCSIGSWTMKPVMGCVHPGYGAGPITKLVYLEDVVQHQPRKRNESIPNSGSDSSSKT